MTTANDANLTGRGYWRSLQELAGSPEFRRHLDSEFPDGIDGPAAGFSRRRFLQIMAASAAMAGLTGCRWPQERIIPFAARPDGFTPGKTQQFATALELPGLGTGVALLVTSYDGRPIKVDGNPEHPWSLGAASAQMQASVLDLWNVDRSRSPVRRRDNQEVRATWNDFAAFAAGQFDALAERDGRGLAFLAGASSSPTRARLRAQLAARFPSALWFRHEPAGDHERLAGTARAFGRSYRDLTHVEHARVIADFDADLLHAHPAALRNARMFARGRRPARDQMNRLYVFESTLSPTGAAADHRIPLPRTQISLALAALAVEVFLERGVALPDGAGISRSELAGWRDRVPALPAIAVLAEDLAGRRGQGLVVVGDRQPAWAHHLAAVLNVALGNVGRTVTFVPAAAPDADLTALVDALQAGRIETLVILDGNPVATAPADLHVAAALARATVTIHLADRLDATSERCLWHLPRAHYLETWGDALAVDGGLLAVQPLIEPLHGGRSELELLALLAGDPAPRGYDLVRTTFHQRAGGRGQAPAASPSFEADWRRFLHDGFTPVSTAAAQTPALTGAGLQLAAAAAPNDENLELVIAPDPRLGDGRFADNAWLQELPDFATKVVWDNVAALSPATAAALRVAHGDLLELEYAGQRQRMPAYVLPGHAAAAVTVTLGHGRRDCGRVGRGVGHDAYALRVAAAPHGGIGLKITKTGHRYALSCTQDHHAIDPIGYQERERRVGSLVRQADLDHYLAHPDFVDHLGVHHPPLVSLWTEKEYTGHKWGMAIDLSVCIGCNACQVACQAENNIPVVGKNEVGRSREMSWIRIDRYFQGDPENPEIAAQPIACAHCELAPCEQVCPVAATVHTEEGLNAMVYNRCVGTRYCANNCPYKVRRFNFFNNIKQISETEKMRLNPQVTVRSRGVMEKCTYCVQRIETAKITAKNERRPLRDGEITPACAQTCPTEAIVFGDLNDPQSRVSRARAEKRSYDLLAYLNIKPRTSYLARIRNPHPRLASHGEEAGRPGGHKQTGA
ncbi:MAG: TAT-variant-translocated molybdopterin oxidoreductase [Candidatus Krumholzibacteria bacterium]|jgi:molybdopterin-containing oxidoreductase family iron-sulfur binding subunit|nr:TAT-variant-translocated molybdopterin oxidoreductase [Candidatus Krumholzibacteria bacterium]